MAIPLSLLWPENQILIPDLTYFHCPGTTQTPALSVLLFGDVGIFILVSG